MNQAIDRFKYIIKIENHVEREMAAKSWLRENTLEFSQQFFVSQRELESAKDTDQIFQDMKKWSASKIGEQLLSSKVLNFKDDPCVKRPFSLGKQFVARILVLKDSKC